MATIKFIRSNSMSNLLKYCSNPDKIGAVGSLNCSLNPRREMLVTRKLYNKNRGTQGFHLIQSFDGYEIDRHQANKIGLELAKAIAPDFEVIVYTHVNTDNIHNHIIINSVNFRTGRKFHQTNYKTGKSKATDTNLRDVREISDRLCRDRGLSVVKEPACTRTTMAERKLAQKGIKTWKEDLRQAVDAARVKTTSFADFKRELQQQNIDINIYGKNIVFRHPDVKTNTRGTRLGENYTRDAIMHDINRTPADSFRKIQEINKKLSAEIDPGKQAELQILLENERNRLSLLQKSETVREPVERDR